MWPIKFEVMPQMTKIQRAGNYRHIVYVIQRDSVEKCAVYRYILNYCAAQMRSLVYGTPFWIISVDDPTNLDALRSTPLAAREGSSVELK